MRYLLIGGPFASDLFDIFPSHQVCAIGMGHCRRFEARCLNRLAAHWAARIWTKRSARRKKKKREVCQEQEQEVRQAMWIHFVMRPITAQIVQPHQNITRLASPSTTNNADKRHKSPPPAMRTVHELVSPQPSTRDHQPAGAGQRPEQPTPQSVATSFQLQLRAPGTG